MLGVQVTPYWLISAWFAAAVSICTGIKFKSTNLATSWSGYVTAPICLHPIQLGLKKSSKMGLLVFLAVSRALSRSFTQQTCIAMDPLLSKNDNGGRFSVTSKRNHP